MKRYMVFAGDTYYPLGGFKDFQSDFDILENAVIFAKEKLGGIDFIDWIHIVDTADSSSILYDRDDIEHMRA